MCACPSSHLEITDMWVLTLKSKIKFHCILRSDDELMIQIKAGLDRKTPKFPDEEVLTFESHFVGPINDTFPGFTRTLSDTWFQDIP